MSAGDIAEILGMGRGPDAPGGARCYSAIARVVDDDPMQVLQEGDANGLSVACMIMDGPFAGSTVTALAASPLGSGFRSSPVTAGDRVVLLMPSGTTDGLVIAIASLLGGQEKPIPSAVAGVAVDEGGLQDTEVHQPEKGVGVRHNIRGAPFCIRLRGAKADYVGEFYLEGDDGAPPNNTAIRMVWDPSSEKLGIKMRDAAGAFIQVGQGGVTICSPNGENKIEVSDDGVSIMGTVITLAGDQLTDIHGGAVLLNMPSGVPPVPGVSSVAQGPGAPLNTFSATVHVGP
jgi:hypothetical protein